LIAEGFTSKEVAARLFISNSTVETHVTNMLNKLGLSSRTQLARWVE
jgi:DNA-binding NarL/FixJ family response regulator